LKTSSPIEGETKRLCGMDGPFLSMPMASGHRQHGRSSDQHRITTNRRSHTMCDNIKALIAKAWKDEEVNLEPGQRYEFDEVLMVHVTGTVTKQGDTSCSPTVSIPLIPTLALFWEKSGIAQDHALRMLREAITDAMSSGKDTSDEIQARIKHVETAIQTVKEELLDKLPKQRRAGRVVTKDLRIEVLPVLDDALVTAAA
jgi:hypothetical protein